MISLFGFGESRLSRKAYFGDGGAIPESVTSWIWLPLAVSAAWADHGVDMTSKS
jgi:hypothetical protein